MSINLPPKRNIHRPTHLYLNNKIYFVTGKTFHGEKYLNTNQKKIIFMQIFNNLSKQINLRTYAWILLDNHYHFLISFNNSLTAVNPIIPSFINRLHSITALKINRIDNAQNRKFWYQYFDRCIRSKKDFWTRFNYIHNNPIKHGYIKNPESLNQYRFSSYNQWIKKNDKEWMASCFAQYPVIDFTCENGLE
jgi:putative transposase